MTDLVMLVDCHFYDSVTTK